MTKKVFNTIVKVTLSGAAFAVTLYGVSSALSDDTPAAAKVSSYAPAEDLSDQLHAIAGRLDDLLAKPDEYDLARQSRIAKEADVAAVVALGLGLSDQDHPAKAGASSALTAALALAKAEDYAAAKDALGKLKEATDGKPAPTSAVRKLAWEPVAPLGLLMKEVPIINSSLKRGVQGERLKSQAKTSAAAAATLAVIAQESATDHDAIKNAADTPKWEQFCFEMRDAAGSVDQAIHAGDAERVQQAMGRLSKSCEQCHRAFRH